MVVDYLLLCIIVTLYLIDTWSDVCWCRLLLINVFWKIFIKLVIQWIIFTNLFVYSDGKNYSW